MRINFCLIHRTRKRGKKVSIRFSDVGEGSDIYLKYSFSKLSQSYEFFL